MAKKYASLADAMAAGDALAEVEIRYRLLAEVFEAEPKLRGNLNTALATAKEEIAKLRAAGPPRSEKPGEVVAFDPARFRRSGA